MGFFIMADKLLSLGRPPKPSEFIGEQSAQKPINMDEQEKELPYYGICKTVIIEAKMQALQIARELNEAGIGMGMVGRAELMAEAEEVFQWFIENMEE